jgi:hypothetical protein
MSDPIVFVVGAGASLDLDPTQQFPLGSQLAFQIEKLLSQEIQKNREGDAGPIANAIMSSGGMGNSHIEAMKRIRDGIQSKNSIDEFIYEWSDVEHLPEIAKLCISERILSAERASALFGLDQKGADKTTILRELKNRWLDTILSHASPGCRRRDMDECLQNVSFITFNYDRCVEQYIFHVLNNTFAMSTEQAKETLNGIKIFHVYGSLGPLQWSDPNGVPFGAPDFYVAQGAKRIKTFTEELASPHLSGIRSLVRSAAKIVFLGCAFHEQNLKILFDDIFNKDQKIWGTVVGMRPLQVNAVMQKFSSALHPQYFEPSQCSDLMNSYFEAIFET